MSGLVYLDGWLARIGFMMLMPRVMEISFVCIDLKYQCQGAGSLLTSKVLEMAREEGLPVYLESTEVAVKMYEKLKFHTVGGFEMRIPTRDDPKDEGWQVYKEVCMLWRPESK